MAQYLVLLYESEPAYANLNEDENASIYQAHMQFGEANREALVGGNALHTTDTATSIRSDGNGDFVVTDGPFAEAKEALGGYYLIEAADLDAAITIAKQVPARLGGVEVRPIRIFD
jgi:hypothetical protein